MCGSEHSLIKEGIQFYVTYYHHQELQEKIIVMFIYFFYAILLSWSKIFEISPSLTEVDGITLSNHTRWARVTSLSADK